MENETNERKNLKNMFIYAKRDVKLTDAAENAPLLGFLNSQMIFESKRKVLKKIETPDKNVQDSAKSGDNTTKKFLFLNGKKFQIVQHREVIKLPKKALATEAQRSSERFEEKTEEYGNGKKKIVLTPLNFMSHKSPDSPKPTVENTKKSIAVQTLNLSNNSKVDRSTSYEHLRKIAVETQTDLKVNKKEIAIQTEEPFALLTYVWNRYLNDPNVDDLITGEDINFNEGNKESKEVSQQKLRVDSEKKCKKQKFHQDFVGCLVWDSGNLPIHKAVIEKNVAMLKRQCVVLKVRQCDVNIRNHQNLTPLHLAILEDADVYVVGVLLKNDAKPSLRDPSGNNALHLAVLKNRYDLVEILMEKKDVGDVATLDIDCYNHEGLTPLMLCAFDSDRIDMAEKLLIKGAQANLKDLKSGRTALFHAAENHNTPMVSLLLDYSADTKIRNFFGTSVHDAMFELDDIPKEIKYPILGRDLKVHQKRKLHLQESSAGSTSVISNMASAAAAAMMVASPTQADLIKRQKLEIVPTYQKIEQNSKFVVNKNKKFRNFALS